MATAADVAATSGESKIDALLSSNASESANPDSGQPADAPAQQNQAAVDSQAQAPDDGATTAQGTDDESALYPQEGETDFAEDVYQRFAKHLAKTNRLDERGVLDKLADPMFRAVLRETIQRGQALNELKSAQEQQAQPSDDDDAAPAQDALSQQPTSEDIKKFMAQVSEYAKQVVHPEIGHAWAVKFLAPLMGAEAAGNLRPEQTQAVTQAFAEGGLHLLNTALPAIVQNLFNQFVSQSFPELAGMHSNAVTERAFGELKTMRDAKTGKPLFPNLDQLRQSGAIDAVYQEYPHLRDAEFIEKGQRLSPAKAKVKELAMVVKLARGESVSPAALNQAVQKGREDAQTRQQLAQAAKLAAGESKGGFQQPSDVDKLMHSILGEDNSPQGRWRAEMARIKPTRS